MSGFVEADGSVSSLHGIDEKTGALWMFPIRITDTVLTTECLNINALFGPMIMMFNKDLFVAWY